jgi:hypothetical protein
MDPSSSLNLLWPPLDFNSKRDNVCQDETLVPGVNLIGTLL